MKITFEPDGTPEALAGLLSRLDADAEVAGILVLACDDNGYTPDGVDACLRATGKPVFGGVFPQIVYGQQHLTRGTIAVGLPTLPQVALLEHLSGSAQDFDEWLTSAFPEAANGAGKSMFVFVDGFASRISALIDALFNAFGLEINYLGGGCGSLSLVPKPCVISNRGLVQDGAVMALLDLPSGVGVAHGWLPISEAYKVTQSTGNIIHSLDWRPAYQVYREVVEAHSGQRFDEQNFFSIAKAYPFGIAKLGTEMVVRDPLMTQGEALVCVGEVPQGVFVRILNGDQASLLSAATHARDMARAALGGHLPHTEFFIDCISRVLFLEDRFALELEAVRDAGLPMIGALTIGEIANSGEDYLEFYNKTAVVGLI
jgi:hypothetical protein